MTTNQPTITPTEDGPYRLDDGVEVTRMRDGAALPVEGTAHLCRCGGSANKPFCDGTHMKNGFSGGKDPDRVPDQGDSYSSSDGRITIHDNRGLCAHAGRCTDNLASVFRLRTEPFVDPRRRHSRGNRRSHRHVPLRSPELHPRRRRASRPQRPQLSRIRARRPIRLNQSEPRRSRTPRGCNH